MSRCTFKGFETGLRVSTVTAYGAPIVTSMVNNRYESNVFEQNSDAGFRITDPSRHTATDYFLLDSFVVVANPNNESWRDGCARW